MFKSYYDCYLALVKYYNEGIEYKKDNVEKYNNDISLSKQKGLYVTDIICTLLVFVTFILLKQRLKQFLEKWLFIKERLRRKDKDRLIECSWRFMFYTMSSCWLTYCCFIRRKIKPFISEESTDYLSQPGLDEYLIVIVELAFYLHATYATIFEDIWRRDSFLVIVHHFAAISIILAGHLQRAHSIILPGMFLRDTCDVILEVTKLSMCFRIQFGKIIKPCEYCVKSFMTLLAIAFVINQLYYYPLFCLYDGIGFLTSHQLDAPIYSAVITSCLMLLLIDVFWFMVIVRILYRMYLSHAPLEDIREYNNEDEEEPKTNHKSSSLNEKSLNKSPPSSKSSIKRD